MPRIVAVALVAAVALILVPGAASAQGAHCQADYAATQDYAAWAGPWGRHGAGLNVRQDGCGAMSWRTYQSCQFGMYDGVCDPANGNEIGHGGKAVFALDTRAGAAAAGRMLARTAAGNPPNFGIVLRLNANGTLTVEWDGEAQTFCRPWETRPLCGA